MKLLAIDPGTTESAYVVLDWNYNILAHDKVNNAALLELIDTRKDISNVAIEMVASYGMPVGREVFETCVWIGRYMQECDRALDIKPDWVYRQQEKLNLCHCTRANDATIHRALVDRFAQFDKIRGTGVKNHPDVFYGFRADQWAAMAVGVTWLDAKHAERERDFDNYDRMMRGNYNRYQGEEI